MNIPPTWWCDIETEVSEDGFPDPEEASTRINTISMTKFPQTIIWSRKNLTEEEKIWIQEQIEQYSEKNYKFVLWIYTFYCYSWHRMLPPHWIFSLSGRIFMV